jgi:hypothetical protein
MNLNTRSVLRQMTQMDDLQTIETMQEKGSKEMVSASSKGANRRLTGNKDDAEAKDLSKQSVLRQKAQIDDLHAIETTQKQRT